VADDDPDMFEVLVLLLDLDYRGGFQMSVDALMALGKFAQLSVKVIIIKHTHPPSGKNKSNIRKNYKLVAEFEWPCPTYHQSTTFRPLEFLICGKPTNGAEN
jgi:hypothetical protein